MKEEFRSKLVGSEAKRSFEFKTDSFDEQKREISISFSSETSNVVRYEYGERFTEILLHKKDSINFDRLRDVGTVLYHHDPMHIIGPIRKLQLNENLGRCEAVIGFDETEEGNTRMMQVKNKSLRGTSFGYTRDQLYELKPKERYQLGTRMITGSEDPNDITIIVERWTPTEITLTPKPWDTDVGVGRSLDSKSDETITTKEGKKMADETKTLTEEQIRSIIVDAIDKAVPTVVEKTRASLIEDSKPKLNVTTEQFRDLTTRASALSPEAMNKVTNLCLEGKTEPEILRYLNDELVKGSDAHKAGVPPNRDAAKRGEKQATNDENVRSFKDITDDQFLNTLKSPGYQLIN